MADTLRDLVVSLSLDTTNFSKNMKSINTQIREAQTYFKETGAGVENYEKTLGGLTNKITTLERVEKAQAEAVKENEKNLAKMNEKYEDAVRNLANAEANLKKVTAQYGENSDEAKKAAEQVEKCKNSLQNANIAQGQAAISLSKANTALKETQAELKKTRKELDGLKWTNVGAAMEKAGEKMLKAGQTMSRAGRTLTRTITTPLVALGTLSGKAYVDFEDSMAGVRKTVVATEEQFEELEDSIRKMALVTPTAASDIAFVMETAGQLGIATDAIEEFTKKMVDFGNVSNSLDATTAAETFARYANIRGDSIEQTNDYFNRLTSTVFKLSNTMATTEADVSEMSMALAAAGTQVGMTDAQIVALAASLSSVGVSAQKGGTAFSKVLVKMEAAVAQGVGASNKALADFAKVAGMTQEEFATLWNQDAGRAFMAFIDGVAKLDEEGTSAIVTLQDLGLNEVRLRDTLLRTVNAEDLFVKAMASANDEWESAEYMSEKVEERYASTANQIEILKNNATDLAMSIGEVLLPYVNDFIGMARDFIARLKELSKEELTSALKTAAFAAAIGPAILALGKITKGIGVVTKGIGLFATAVGKAGGGMSGVGKVLASSPALWLALAAAVAYATYKIWDYVSGAKAAREALQDLDGTVQEWEQDVTTAFEKSGGLSALNMSKEDFGLDSFSKNSQEWVDNLIAVWTDGKKETDDIVQGMVDTWTEGSDQIRKANGITDEDLKTLDEMDAEIEDLLRKRQNGYLTETEKKRLQELSDKRGAIAIKYKLVEDVDSGFDDIVTNVQAALARGADANDVWADAFKAAGEGYGTYMAELNKEFDAKYAEIMNGEGTDEEKANKVDELRTWYIEEKTKALNEYNAALEKSAELTGGAESTKYDKTIQQLGKVADLMKDLEGKDANDPAVVAFANELKDLDEAQIVELLTMIEAFESAGIELPESLATAKKYIDALMNGAEDYTKWDIPEDVLEKFKKMFGKENLEEEVEDVYLNMGVNTDDLTVDINEWASAGGFDPLNMDVDTENMSVDATGIAVDGSAAVNGYLVTVQAEDGTTFGVTTSSGEMFRVGVDGYLRKVNEDGTETLIQDGKEIPEGSYFSVDVNGNLTVVTANGTYEVVDNNGNPLNVGIQGTLSRIVAKQKQKVLNAFGLPYTPDVDAEISKIYAKANGDYKVYEQGTNTEFRAHVTAQVDKFEYDPGAGAEGRGEWLEKIREAIRNKLNSATEGAAARAEQRTTKKSSLFGWEYEDLTSSVFADLKGLIYLKDKYGRDSKKLADQKQFWEEDEKGAKYANQTAQWLVWMQTQIDAGNEISDEDMEHYKQLMELFTLFPEDSQFFTALNGELPDEAGATGREKLINSIKAALGEDLYQEVIDSLAGDGGVEINLYDLIKPKGRGLSGGGGSEGKGGGGRFSKEAQETIDDVKLSLEEAIEESDPIDLEPDDLLDTSDTKTMLKPDGVNLMDGLIAGVNSRTGALAQALIAAVQKAKKAVEDDNKIASPSKVWRDEIGANLAKGIGEGVLQEAPSQGKIIANAARYLTDSAAGAMSGGHSSITGNNTTTNNNVSSNVVNHINITASVRSDNDIRKLAAQIAKLTQRVNGGYGMLSQLKAVKP